MQTESLPQDIQTALSQYDSECANGTIQFANDAEFATDGPGKVQGDQWMTEFVNSKLPEMDR